jgi:hypothetical protein
MPSSAREIRRRLRSSSKAQPASFSPKVRVDAVRAAHLQRRAMLLGAGNDRRKCSVDPVEDERSCLADLQCERGIDDIRRRQPVVEPAALLADPFGDRVDERGRVVMERRLELGNPRRRGHRRPLAQGLRGLSRDDPELGPRLRRGQLDVELAPKPALLRPDLGHGRAGVAGDHCRQSRAGAGRWGEATTAAEVPSNGGVNRPRVALGSST